jgi:hypothetical protein
MMAEVEIRNERVDDLPLLVTQQDKMGIAEIIDEQISPHWRRQGLSVGRIVVVWLAYILSESDHRLSYVEPWVARHLETLKHTAAAELTVQDFNDDRLGDVLRYLSEDASWRAMERELGARLIRVYRLPQECVRMDKTTVSVYHMQVVAEAILQQHRVTGLLLPTYERQASQRQVRKYKDRPARIAEKVRYQLQVSRDEAAIQGQYRTMGWRLYVTNAPVELLSFSQAVLAYRGAPISNAISPV